MREKKANRSMISPIIKDYRTPRTNSSTRLTRQTRVTNSQAAAQKSWLVICTPHALGFSQNNLQGNLNNNNQHCVLTLFSLIMQIIFLLQYNTILLCLESLKEFVFHALSHALKRRQDIFFISSIQNINDNRQIIFLKFFPIIFV